MKKQLKFEYKFQIVTRYNNETFQVECNQKLLDELGQQGWDLISTTLVGQIIYGFFKKQVD